MSAIVRPHPSLLAGRGRQAPSACNVRVKDLVHIGHAKALHGSAARDVDTRPQGCCANAMARRGHGGERLPGIRARLIDLNLGKDALWMGRIAFTTKDIETTIKRYAG